MPPGGRPKSETGRGYPSSTLLSLNTQYLSPGGERERRGPELGPPRGAEAPVLPLPVSHPMPLPRPHCTPGPHAYLLSTYSVPGTGLAHLPAA